MLHGLHSPCCAGCAPGPGGQGLSPSSQRCVKSTGLSQMEVSGTCSLILRLPPSLPHAPKEGTSAVPWLPPAMLCVRVRKLRGGPDGPAGGEAASRWARRPLSWRHPASQRGAAQPSPGAGSWPWGPCRAQLGARTLVGTPPGAPRPPRCSHVCTCPLTAAILFLPLGRAWCHGAPWPGRDPRKRCKFGCPKGPGWACRRGHRGREEGTPQRARRHSGAAAEAGARVEAVTGGSWNRRAVPHPRPHGPHKPPAALRRPGTPASSLTGWWVGGFARSVVLCLSAHVHDVPGAPSLRGVPPGDLPTPRALQTPRPSWSPPPPCAGGRSRRAPVPTGLLWSWDQAGPVRQEDREQRGQGPRLHRLSGADGPAGARIPGSASPRGTTTPPDGLPGSLTGVAAAWLREPGFLRSRDTGLGPQGVTPTPVLPPGPAAPGAVYSAPRSLVHGVFRAGLLAGGDGAGRV